MINREDETCKDTHNLIYVDCTRKQTKDILSGNNINNNPTELATHFTSAAAINRKI